MLERREETKEGGKRKTETKERPILLNIYRQAAEEGKEGRKEERTF
jgi:hypothetical protein